MVKLNEAFKIAYLLNDAFLQQKLCISDLSYLIASLNNEIWYTLVTHTQLKLKNLCHHLEWLFQNEFLLRCTGELLHKTYSEASATLIIQI